MKTISQEEFEEMIQAAYREGFSDGRAEAVFEENDCADGVDVCWRQSDVRLAMSAYPETCSTCDGRKCPACDPESTLMPIETAPKDGTHILLVKFDPNSTGFGWPNGIHQPACEVCHWFDDGFYSSNFGIDQTDPWRKYTHWLPLPRYA